MRSDYHIQQCGVTSCTTKPPKHTFTSGLFRLVCPIKGAAPQLLLLFVARINKNPPKKGLSSYIYPQNEPEEPTRISCLESDSQQQTVCHRGGSSARGQGWCLET